MLSQSYVLLQEYNLYYMSIQQKFLSRSQQEYQISLTVFQLVKSQEYLEYEIPSNHYHIRLYDLVYLLSYKQGTIPHLFFRRSIPI